MKLSHWSFRKPVDAAPAPFLQEPAPEISLTKQPDGTLRLHAVPPPGVRSMVLEAGADAPSEWTVAATDAARLSRALVQADPKLA